MLIVDANDAQEKGRVNRGGFSGAINDCAPDETPCGVGSGKCCPPGYRCGDSKCHWRGVKGIDGSSPQPGSTLGQ